jgi:hypothetical protein
MRQHGAERLQIGSIVAFGLDQRSQLERCLAQRVGFSETSSFTVAFSPSDRPDPDGLSPEFRVSSTSESTPAG